MKAQPDEHLAMNSKRSSTTVTVAFSLVFSSALCAQQTKAPTLDEILQRLDANLTHYDTAVPSFFCDEHVISQVEPGIHGQSTVTDSVFRLIRTPNPDHTVSLIESREIANVNDKPAISQHLDGPTLLSGVFEGGLAVVSLNQVACMNYTLQPINKDRPTEPYAIRFITVLTPRNTADCLLQENTKGRVIIDAASTQITHLELITPRHTIARQVFGKRVITVDYAPVVLAGDTFWMPSTITSRITSGSGTFHMIIWRFRATYRNYHRLEVTSRIIPAPERPSDE